MNTVRFKIILATGLAVVVGYIAWPILQHLANAAARQESYWSGTLPARSHKGLPSAGVESGKTLLCRMLYCDFRFPLPQMTHVAQVDLITGGFDTIKGRVYATNNGKGSVDLRAYSKLLWRDGFTVSSGPFSDFTASSPDGGFVEVENSNNVCEISFSYFGDTY
jgi:hypothetical protein